MLNTIKTQFSDVLHLSKDALHVHIGLGIYVAAMVLLRRGPGSWLPWLTVLVFELLNELLDSWHHGAFSLMAAGSLKDILNTMLWPTVVLFAARFKQSRITANRAGNFDVNSSAPAE